MGEWWTYRLTDFLGFTPRTYYRLFQLYNTELWPAPLAAVVLGLVLLALTLRSPGPPWRGRAVPVLLALAWLWVAWAFHWQRYRTINYAASYFAAAFTLQALLLAGLAAMPGSRRWTDRRPDAPGITILFLVVFVEPLLGPLLGRSWKGVELFAMAPDPTVAATLGLLLIMAAPRPLFIVPLLWCLVSWATLSAMEAPDAWVLPLVAAVALARRVWQWRAGKRPGD